MTDLTSVRDDIMRVKAAVQSRLDAAPPAEASAFVRRFDRYLPDVVELLRPLYGGRDDWFDCLEAILLTAVDGYLARPAELKALDAEREADPLWYQHHKMMGGVCYAGLFAGTLQGVREKIPYFRELGLTYLHLMPLFRTPPGPDDGGYAVSSYREVDPALGTMDDLRALATDLRANGISLALDFVFNHTADDHAWALRARGGDPAYREFYFLFEDRSQPDAYERTLREIFPEEHPGAFTYYSDIDRWVWTTFHTYQWDLNYRNPAVFKQMLSEMLFLANVGAEVLRLDAVPFIWKEMGTSCENLPQAHTIIRAFNALIRIAAPALIFKSEAIVHPADVKSYFGGGKWAGRECEISYHPLLMVLMWEAMATRHTHLLTYSMQQRFTIPRVCAWVNYVRSHDDIGWGFADEDANMMGIHGFGHRSYLNRFYTGQEPGSWAQGYPFQYNPRTEDMRISGTTASLAGLERALEAGDDWEIELAVRRILLMYGIALSMGGIPLLYLGDEVGTLNNYAYKNDPRKADDSRWLHRFSTDWGKVARRWQDGTIEARIYQPLQRLIALRKGIPAFGAAARTEVLDTGSMHVYAFFKVAQGSRMLVLGNFTPDDQTVRPGAIPHLNPVTAYPELISVREVTAGDGLTLGPYELFWLQLD
jgi:amylosucrase